MSTIYIRFPGSMNNISFPLSAPDGSVNAPSYSFSSDSTMGMYYRGTNTLGIVAQDLVVTNTTSSAIILDLINGTSQNARYRGLGKVVSAPGEQVSFEARFSDGVTTPTIAKIFSSNTSNTASSSGGKWTFQTATTAGTLTTTMIMDEKQNVSINTAAIATNATDGFLYIPSCAGAPTGVPTAKTGLVPMVYDSTNNKFYIYNGSWRGVTLT